MARDKTSKERAAEAAERRAARGVSLAKQALRTIQTAKREIDSYARELRALRPLREMLDDKIEWLIAEDESFAHAAAELWKEEHAGNDMMEAVQASPCDWSLRE